jgi:hypothetical protein
MLQMRAIFTRFESFFLLKNGRKWQKEGDFMLKSAKSDRYLSPFEISATAKTYCYLVSYSVGGRFADILAKTI